MPGRIINYLGFEFSNALGQFAQTERYRAAGRNSEGSGKRTTWQNRTRWKKKKSRFRSRERTRGNRRTARDSPNPNRTTWREESLASKSDLLPGREARE